jgi:hypothetical protein
LTIKAFYLRLYLRKKNMIIIPVQQPFDVTLTPLQRDLLKENEALEYKKEITERAMERSRSLLDNKTIGQNIDVTA